MEDVEVALLIAVSIIVVLITSIWWATRTKKRQAEDVKQVKVPLPQDDLRAARNRFYQQKELQKQPSDHQQTGPGETSQPTRKKERLYSFQTLKNSWEQGSNISYQTSRRLSNIPEEVTETLQAKPRKGGILLEAQADDGEKLPAQEPVKHSGDSKMREAVKAKSPLLIQPVRQKVIHYKYRSLPHAKLSGIGYDESGHPIIQPIKSFYKLLSWLPGFDNFNIPCAPLRRRGNSNPDVKILVCHDMMGGYTLDKYPQGMNVIEDYHFYHWHLIDSFVYFSHNFITIPPATWTNAAHTNGVLSMGTIITEWEDGRQVCNHLLSSADNVQKFVEQCVSLANYYQFDGWLVNIENALEPEQVDKLLQLLKSLTDAMHAAKPWSQVIWYDSVITNGQLKWQNALNQFNEPFFNVCDGIFLNYTWNDWMLASSKTAASSSSSRVTDVYVGIDVFGRGCFGGGGYNSVAALKMARKHGLSAAIFAPGWVFETQNKENFIKNQDKFWSLLEPYCVNCIVEGLPLVATFCRGYGELVAVDGKVVHEGEWTNHSAQDFQLSFDKDMFELGVKGSLFFNTVEISTQLAYNNSSSLSLVGKVFKYGVSSRTIIRLFMSEANFNKPLLVAYTYSLATPGSLLHSLQLHTNKAPRYVMLDPLATTFEDAELDSVNQQLLTKYGLIRSCDRQVEGMSGIDQSNYVCFAPLPLSYSQYLHKMFTGHEELTTGQWTTCYFLVTSKELSTAVVREVRLVCEPPANPVSDNNDFFLSVGEIKVLNPRCVAVDYIHATVSHLSCCDVSCSQEDQMLSATLHWQLHQNNPIDPTLHYNIYHRFDQNDNDMLFTGRAFSTHYRVTGVKLPDVFEESKHCEVMFYIQSVSQSGRKLPILDCPSLAMNWD